MLRPSPANGDGRLFFGFARFHFDELIVGGAAGDAAFFGSQFKGVFTVELGLLHEFLDAFDEGGGRGASGARVRGDASAD